MIDAETGEEVGRGVVPPWCVAVHGHPAPTRSPAASSACRACWSSSASTEGERHDKAKLNEILRDHGVDRLIAGAVLGRDRPAAR